MHFFPERCVGCDTCIKTCRFGSSPRICNLTPEETFEQIKKQIPFISGVTVSGGECSLYCKFVESLFKLCKEAGLNTMMDSNGSTPFAGKDDLLAVTDGVMLDIKAFGEEDHLKVTAMPNKNTLENAVFLAKMGKLLKFVPSLYQVCLTLKIQLLKLENC
ncbi:MAG: radical SAM protein [Lachnospiraceae bacterium]